MDRDWSFCRRWQFLADGVPLAVDLCVERRVRALRRTPVLDGAEVAAVIETLGPVLTGYSMSGNDPKATLEVRLNKGAVVLRHRPGPDWPTAAGSRESAMRWVSYERDTPITDLMYVPFAVDQWVHDASLAVAPAGTVRLHAAGFELDGETWLVIGESGAGKSTAALRAIAAGATYLSDERMTVHPNGRVTGLRRPVRSRDTPESVKQLIGEHQTVGRDAFRTLVPASVTDDRPRRCSRLLILSDDSAEEWSRPKAVRMLSGCSQDLIREGPAGLALLCDLVANAFVWVRPPRTVTDLRQVGPPTFRPLDNAASVTELRLVRGQGPPGWEVTADATAMSIGEEAVAWVPGTQPLLVGLNAAATDAWRSLAHGKPDRLGDDEFHDSLAACGVLRRVQPGVGGQRLAEPTTDL